MKKKILVKTQSLKAFLELFNKKELIESLELGDTWHPSSGFVEEEILEGNRRIKDILEFPYDFKGLVHLKGQIRNFEIKYIDSEFMKPNNFERLELYEITGSELEIKEIENKIIELNAYYPQTYDYSIQKLYNEEKKLK